MRLFSLLVVASCAKSTPASSPSNTTSATEPAAPASRVPVTAEMLPLGPAGTCAVGGLVVDTKSSEPIAGATIVIAKETVLSDEHGTFLVQASQPPTAFDVYYTDLTQHVEYGAAACGHALRITLDTSKTF